MRWFWLQHRLWVDTVVEEVFGGKQERRRAQRKSKVVYTAYTAYLEVTNVYGGQASVGWEAARETALGYWETLAAKLTKDAMGESSYVGNPMLRAEFMGEMDGIS